MEITLQPKDYNPPNQYLSVEAQTSEQYLGPLGPLSIQGPRGLGSLNDDNDQQVLPINQRLQLSDLENPNDLQGLQPGRQPSDQQPQFNMGLPSPDLEAQDSLSSEPTGNAGGLSFLVDFILGDYKSNPIWRLRLLSAICLYIAVVIGFLFYPGDLSEAHAPYHYQTVMLLTSVAPFVVATISLFVSFWIANIPNNWITGLSIANISMLCGPLIVYWAHKQGTGK